MDNKNLKGNKIKTYIINTILIVSIFLPLLSMVSINVRASGSGNYPPPSNGDWVINNTTVVENETIVLNGNLTINNGGNLTFKNVTLIMNCTSDGQYGITVNGGGSFYILENSNMTAYNSSNEFKFLVNSGSVFEMRNSELSECGYEWADDGRAGLTIKTNAIIQNNGIHDNYIGIYFEYSNNNKIENNNVYSNSEYGVSLYYSNSSKIENNSVYSNNNGILLGSSNNNQIANNNVYDNYWNGIYFYSLNNNTITNSTISNSGNRDFYLDSNSTNNTAINTTFSTIYVSSNSELIVKNYLEILVVDRFGIPIQNATVSVKDNGNEVFNGTTDENGLVSWILITDGIYNGSSIATENETSVFVYKDGFTFANNSRNVSMNTSHRETFQSNEAIPEFNSFVIPIFIMIAIFFILRKNKKGGV